MREMLERVKRVLAYRLMEALGADAPLKSLVPGARFQKVHINHCDSREEYIKLSGRPNARGIYRCVNSTRWDIAELDQDIRVMSIGRG